MMSNTTRNTMSRGFTLLELVITASIVAVLVFTILPALHSARSSARQVVCLNNVKALTTAWTQYARENNEYLVGGSKGESPYAWVGAVQDEGFQAAQKAIRQGKLHDYLTAADQTAESAYHCPEHRTDEDASTLAISYAIAGGMNGEHQNRAFTRAEQLPNPSGDYVFVESDDLRRPGVGSFLANVSGAMWVDPPAIRHRSGGVFGFVDGHVESYQYREKTTFSMYREKQTFAVTPRSLDLQYIRHGYAHRVTCRDCGAGEVAFSHQQQVLGPMFMEATLGRGHRWDQRLCPGCMETPPSRTDGLEGQIGVESSDKK